MAESQFGDADADTAPEARAKARLWLWQKAIVILYRLKMQIHLPN
ncbi:hypothetical protein [Burkholderia sp. 9120]|nr:hypothetical protein [Burkholderia sp. 9120]